MSSNAEAKAKIWSRTHELLSKLLETIEKDEQVIDQLGLREAKDEIQHLHRQAKKISEIHDLEKRNIEKDNKELAKIEEDEIRLEKQLMLFILKLNEGLQKLETEKLLEVIQKIQDELRSLVIKHHKLRYKD